MNNTRIFLAFVVCFVIAQNILAQQYFTKSYTIENGLPTRIVYDVCQDTCGLMWFATHDGISSYDGFSFTNYDASKGLPRQHFRKLKYDEKGILWGTPDKLCDTIVFLQGKTWKRLTPATTRTDIEITSFDLFYMEGNPVICVGTTTGIEVNQNGRWSHFDLSDDQQKNHIFSVTAKSGTFYVLTTVGLWKMEQSKTAWNFSEFVKFQGEKIIAVRFDKPGSVDEKLWMLSSNRLTFLQHGKVTLVTNGFSLPEAYVPGISYINCDHKGNVFFGNSWAKYFINGVHGKCEPLMVRNGFSSNGATALFIDREENVWFADTRGVDKVSNLLKFNYFERDGLLDNEVTAIVELAGGGMVFGHNNGLSVFDLHHFKRIAFPVAKNKLSRVLDMIRDDHGNVWFTANSLGFGKLMPDGRIRWYPVDSTSLASTVFQDARGKIWMGTNRNLYCLENDKLVPYESIAKIYSPFRKIASRGNGEIIGTSLYGLYIIGRDTVKIVKVAGELKTQSIYSYYRNSAGTEFVGTLNGLGVIDNNVIRKFEKNGISLECPVYFVFQDHARNYWFGSNNGVYKWDGKDKLEIFTLQNGLAGREANRSAGIVDSKGNVWIGTDMGLSCFLPGFSGMKTQAPVMKLLDVADNKGTRHSLAENCTIKFNDNTLYFHFRGISFVNENLIFYRYKLEGFDHNWQFVDQSDLDMVKYSGVQPGRYKLLVQARNGSGDWSELVTSGTITISTPYYKSWWFILVIFLVVCVIVFGAVKIVMQQKYNLKLENEISEREKSEQKTVQTLHALHASELKYRELIEFAVDGILIGSKNGMITGANTYMQKLSGRSPDNLIGIHINQLFREDHLSQIPLRFDLLEKGEMVVSSRKICRPDGTVIPVEMHTKMMPDGSYQSIFHDISKRQQAEEKLRESRELYKLITDKMTDVVWLMDLKGKSIFVSPSIEQFTGFSVGEYLQQTVDVRFTLASTAVVKRLFEEELPRLAANPESLHGYSNIQHMEYVCKDGGTKWGELLLTPYFGANGAWIGIHGVTRDITRRKQLEDALRESEEKFVKAFQNSPDPFAITRLSDGKYLNVNESYVRYSGYSREELIGKTINELNVWANLDDRRRYAAILRENGRVVDFETTYKTRSAELRDCIASAELIDINGEKYILAIIHDITDRKLSEAALKEKAHELERFNSLMVGRELKMIELKKEINSLLVMSNQPEKYVVHE